MNAPKTAMILAAGLGTRMRPLTDRTPKPLIRVSGRSMLARALDHLDQAGISRKIVNVHWLGDAIRRATADRKDIVISDESDALLETGGGVKRALPLLGDDPFFALNADMVWTNGAENALIRLGKAWDPRIMDALLLLVPVKSAFGYDGRGDFFLNEQNIPARRGDQPFAPYIFGGVQILSPTLFSDTPEGAFSLNLVYDKALRAGRLSALVHDGNWYHIGTPEALKEAEKLIPEA